MAETTAHKAFKRSTLDGAASASGPVEGRAVRTSYAPCPCRACGVTYTPRHLEQEFCSPACRKDWNNLAIQRGFQAYELLTEWRVGRRLNLISALCALVRDWRADDRKAGRVWRARIYNPNTGRRHMPKPRQAARAAA
ncbi:hypothetical protein [Azospirillum tabaci]|uniref:hypothetical protein n=1 Tax=Azospirillum tabaci TaxID=2752310 RepID=UPI001660C6EE|nr:hypothetical protein [Azospirillum tabaci]